MVQGQIEFCSKIRINYRNRKKKVRIYKKYGKRIKSSDLDSKSELDKLDSDDGFKSVFFIIYQKQLSETNLFDAFDKLMNDVSKFAFNRRREIIEYHIEHLFFEFTSDV